MKENIYCDSRGDCTTNPQQQLSFIPKCGRRKISRNQGNTIDVDFMDGGTV